MNEPSYPTRGLSTQEVSNRSGCSRASIYEMLDEGSAYYDPGFPRPFKIGRRTLFVEAEIEQWLQSKIAARQLRSNHRSETKGV